VACSGARGDELRLDDGRQRHHELVDREIDSVCPISIFCGKRSDRIEHAIDLPGVPCHRIEVVIDDCIIQSVDDRDVGPTTFPGDLCGHLVNVRLRAPGQKDFCAFSRELPGDGSANRSAGAEDNSVLSLQKTRTVHQVLRTDQPRSPQCDDGRRERSNAVCELLCSKDV
jgi:hypothetical protein